MKIRVRRTIVLILAVVALVGAAYSLLRVGFSVDVMNRSGWHEKDGAVQYRNYFGRPYKGWQYIDEKLYYFQEDTGNMATGWQEVEGSRYYFGQDGVRATGWQKVQDATYYLGEDGKMVTGWRQVDGRNYLFTDSGAMATGWQVIDGNRSYFTQEGMALTGWQTFDGKLYYFTEQGYTLSGTVVVDDLTYHFTDEGSVLTGWYSDEKGTYFLNEKGQPHIGWLELEEKRYYLDENGLLITGWLTENNDRYYLYEDGTMAIGRAEIDGAVNFFTSKGKWVLMCNPWNPVPEDFEIQLVTIEGYRFDSDGRDALQQMIDDCRAAGYSCVINNTYRSKATQQYLWDRSVAQYMSEGMTREQAEIETGKSTAIPGNSEHQTGLAVDLNGSNGTYDWLEKYCWDYGFILRYPDDKIDITGIIYEPWHFRYVGTELALELKVLGITMEEYMTMITPK